MPEIFDPTRGGAPSLPVPAHEDEILSGRRAFAKAQELLSGAPVGASDSVQVGWYDTSVHPETGSFAVLNYSAGLDRLIGEIVRVSYETRSVFAYVLQDVQLPDGVELALTRRTFLAIARLSLEVVTADVAVIA